MFLTTKEKTFYPHEYDYEDLDNYIVGEEEEEDEDEEEMILAPLSPFLYPAVCPYVHSPNHFCPPAFYGQQELDFSPAITTTSGDIGQWK